MLGRHQCFAALPALLVQCSTNVSFSRLDFSDSLAAQVDSSRGDTDDQNRVKRLRRMFDFFSTNVHFLPILILLVRPRLARMQMCERKAWPRYGFFSPRVVVVLPQNEIPICRVGPWTRLSNTS
ncbi:unnamed protein product [Ectocarpus sp. 12 AP-2014]